MSEEKDFISDLSDEEKQNLADFFINLGAYIMYARQKPLADKSKEEKTMTETQVMELLHSLHHIKSVCVEIETCGPDCPMYLGRCMVKTDFPKDWELTDAPILQPRVFGGNNG